MISSKMSKLVQDAAKEYGIDGVMAVTDNCALSYPRVKRVWNGDLSAKFSDYVDVMKSLGYNKVEFNKDEK